MRHVKFNVQRRLPITRLMHLSVAIFVFYSIALFVPSVDSGEFFEFQYGLEYFVNKTTWHLLLGSVLIISALKPLTGRTRATSLEFSFLITGLFCILYNLILTALGSPTNFNYVGFFFLTCLAIFDTDEEILAKAVAFALIFLSLGTLLTIADSFFGFKMSPIIVSRYAVLTENSDELRLAVSSLLGQKNAAGSALAFALLCILLRLKNKGGKLFLAAYIVGFLALIFTTAFGPIAVSISSLILHLTSANKKVKLSLLLFILFFTLYYTFDISSFIEYKGGSGSIKYERFIAFFTTAFSSPSILILGENVERIIGDEGFYTESSFLDFWLNFGLSGALSLLVIIALGLLRYLKMKEIFTSCIIILIFILILTQNSSLMPANIVILLVIYAMLFSKRSRQSSFITSL